MLAHSMAMPIRREDHINPNIVKRRIRSFWIAGISLTALFFLVHEPDWVSSPEFHTIIEVIAMLLALTVGAMALVRYYSVPDNKFLIIGAGFLGTGFLDGYHAIVTSTYFKAFMPSDLPALIPWSWVASRLFLGVLLYASWKVWQHESSRPPEERLIKPFKVYWLTGIATILCFLFFAFYPLPRAYYPEFNFHRPEEFVPALFFLLAMIGYLSKGEWKYSSFEYWLVMCLVVNLVGEALVMSHSARLFDAEFDLAHFLKDVSYICALVGLLCSMFYSFRQAEYEVEKGNKYVSALLQREAELKKSNEALESFAHVASHDMQEPLRKIQAFGEMLDNEVELESDAKHYLERMMSASSRMSQLINDLLFFSRVTAKGSTFVPTDLNDVVRDALETLEIRIQETDADIIVEPLPVIDADPVQMHQLFQNLIGNALKYSKKDVRPKIQIGLKSSSLKNTHKQHGSDHHDTHWCIVIEDNGIGFKPEYKERIFEMFQRLHARTEYDGTGIGLPICRRIVAQHGGKITATGKQDVGARMTVTLKKNHIEKKHG